MRRNFGLDLLRSIAIVLVLIDHMWYLLPTAGLINPLSVFGFLGVELFFVLSGFLIGRILLKTFISKASFKDLKRFYLRRWLRTIPIYYALLVSLIMVSNIIYHSFNLHVFYFVFLQNFFPKESDFFGVAWSLAIEEWFYLVVPIIFILLTPSVRLGKGLIKILVLTIAAILMVKLFSVIFLHLSFEAVRINIPLRFDSLLIGVLLASVKSYQEKIYQKAHSFKLFILSVCILIGIGLYYSYFYMQGATDKSFFLRSLVFTCISICVAVMIPFLEGNSFINTTLAENRFVFRFFTTISLISYSLYLIHLQIFTFTYKIFSDRIPSLILIVGTFGITFLTAYILYRCFEKPIMDWRDRITAV